MGRWQDWDDYTPTRPLPARGGIKAQSQRGAFGKNWWARRWIEVLEGFRIGERLARGRAYARQGQVLAIAVQSGAVTARVQGSRKQPYRVEIKVPPLTPGQWERLAAALATQPVFLAKLLAGEMPPDIEEAFRAAGLSLFPERSADLTTDCSCPDWSNPCKHIAAVYYLLGEEFDRDPFLIFQMRGLSRDGLIGLLGGAEATPNEAPGLVSGAEPLPAALTAFWAGGGLPGEIGDVRIPATAAALPRQLGHFPFWQGEAPLVEMLEPVYARVSPRAMDAVVAADTIDQPLNHPLAPAAT